MISASLQLVSSSFAGLPLLVLIFKKFRVSAKYYPFVAYILLAAFTEVLLITAERITLHYMNAFTCLSFLLFGWIFVRLIENNNLRKTIIISTLILFVLSVLNMFFYQGIYYFNSYSLMIQVVFVTLLSAVLIYQSYKNIEPGVNFFKHADLVIALTFFYYFGTSFFVFTYAFEAMRFDTEFTFNIWDIHSGINILFNCFLAYSVYVVVNNSKINE